MSDLDAGSTADVEGLLRLAEILRDPDGGLGERNDYRRARKVLDRAAPLVEKLGESAPELRRRAVLARVRAWLDDPGLHKWRATTKAWDILSSAYDLYEPQDPEVLGLAGRINRRRWEMSGQSRDLRRAAYLYQIGYEHKNLPPAEGDDYVRLAERTALNGLQGAILLIELARLEERTLHSLKTRTKHEERVPPIGELQSDPVTRDLVNGIEGLTAPQLRATALRMMTDARDLLAPIAWREKGTWLQLTGLAALEFGLRRYPEAKAAAAQARLLIDEAAKYPGGPSDPDVHRWVRELVLIAHQRGIRPEVSAYERVDKERRGVDQSAPLDEVRIAGQLRVGDVEDDARRALEKDKEGVAIETIAETLGYDSPDKARDAIIRAEQREVLDVVTRLVPDGTESLAVDLLAGKTGMALSGGGFRAAFYHAGVLAGLADAGVLPRIEVVSCVSGGSIAGMYYYLRLKELLESKSDAEITKADYRAIVHDLCEGLLRGSARDLRSRVFANPVHNLRMLRGYSPSMRLGDLLQEHVLPKIVDRVGDGEGLAGTEVKVMSQLRIKPRTSAADGPLEYKRDFWPRGDNWTRSNKVPILILNATSLNTGHNWQFTAAHMGEPPAMIHPEIDANPRLRRVPISSDRSSVFSKPISRAKQSLHGRKSGADEAHRRDEERQKLWEEMQGLRTPAVDAAVAELELDQLDPNEVAAMPLGQAVAASAAIPGLFEPVAVRAGYPPMLVKLSDGGVVDNQGISGLLEQDCDTLFVSDASRQLTLLRDPGGGVLPALRSTTIAKERIRAAQYEELRTLRRSQLLRDFLFVHLNLGLDAEPIGWRGAAGPAAGYDEVRDDQDHGYKVDRGIQRALARMRTDIDVFSEIEAWALMTTGYNMVTTERRGGVGPFRFTIDDGKEAREWPFLAVKELIGTQVDPKRNADLAKRQRKVRRHLDASRRAVFRSLGGRDPRRAQSKPTSPYFRATGGSEGESRQRQLFRFAGMAALLVLFIYLVRLAIDVGGSFHVGLSIEKSLLVGVAALAVIGTLLLVASRRPATPAAVAWRLMLIVFGGVVLFVVSWFSLLGTALGKRRGRVPSADSATVADR